MSCGESEDVLERNRWIKSDRSARIRGPSRENAMKRRLLYIILFLLAFLLTLAISLPLDLLAARIVFARAAEATGMTWSANTVRLSFLSFPPAVEAVEVSVTLPGGTLASVPRARLQAGWGLLVGRRSLALTLDPGDGEIAIDVAQDRVRVEARGLRLERLPVLKLFTEWRYAGTLDLNGEWRGATLAEANGEFRWRADDLRVEGARLLGIEFPPARLGVSEGRLTLANAALVVAEGAATGGTLGVGLSGQVTLSKSWRESVLAIVTTLTPTPEWEEGLGSSAGMLRFVRRPDGTLRLTTTGTIAKPQVALQ